MVVATVIKFCFFKKVRYIFNTQFLYERITSMCVYVCVLKIT